jgi:WD40 repeat protein
LLSSVAAAVSTATVTTTTSNTKPAVAQVLDGSSWLAWKLDEAAAQLWFLDDERLLTRNNAKVQFRDLADGHVLQEIQLPKIDEYPSWGTSALSADGSLLAAYAYRGGGDVTGKLYLFELPSGQMLRALDTKFSSTPTSIFTPDKTRLITSSDEVPAIGVWDVATGKLIRRLPFLPATAPPGARAGGMPPEANKLTHRLFVSADGKRVAEHSRNAIEFIELDTGKREALDKTRLGKAFEAFSMALTPNWDRVFAGGWRSVYSFSSSDGNKWDLKSSTSITGADVVDLTADGRFALSSNYGDDGIGKMTLWDAVNVEPIANLKLPSMGVWQLRFSPSQRFAAASAGQAAGFIALWRLPEQFRRQEAVGQKLGAVAAPVPAPSVVLAPGP